MIVDIERRGHLGRSSSGEAPAVPDSQLLSLANKLDKYGVTRVLHVAEATITDSTLVVASGLSRVVQARHRRGDNDKLTVEALPSYEAVIYEAHRTGAAAIVPVELGLLAKSHHHMGSLAFMAFAASNADVSMVAPLSVIAPHDFAPVSF